MAPVMRIGELLVAAGLITDEQLQQALADHKTAGVRLGEYLVTRDLVNELELTQILSNQLSVAWVSLEHVEFSKELLSLVSEELAQAHTVIPVHFRLGKKKEKILYIAMDDPTNVLAMEDISRVTGMHVRPLIAPPGEIKKAIQLQYSGSG